MCRTRRSTGQSPEAAGRTRRRPRPGWRRPCSPLCSARSSAAPRIRSRRVPFLCSIRRQRALSEGVSPGEGSCRQGGADELQPHPRVNPRGEPECRAAHGSSAISDHHAADPDNGGTDSRSGGHRLRPPARATRRPSLTCRDRRWPAPRSWVERTHHRRVSTSARPTPPLPRPRARRHRRTIPASRDRSRSAPTRPPLARPPVEHPRAGRGRRRWPSTPNALSVPAATSHSIQKMLGVYFLHHRELLESCHARRRRRRVSSRWLRSGRTKRRSFPVLPPTSPAPWSRDPSETPGVRRIRRLRGEVRTPARGIAFTRARTGRAAGR